MKTPHEPLTPEERALAQSLSRLGPHGGPSPELDARILGAARAAVREAPAPGGQVPPSRRRWPLGMGVAASVLLAAGIAWQLRPGYDVPVASEAPAAAQDAVAVASGNTEAAAPLADVAPATVAAPPVQQPAAAPIPPPAPAKAIPPPPAAVEHEAAPASPARKNAEAAARQDTAPKRSPLALIPAPAPASAPPPAPEAPPQAFREGAGAAPAPSVTAISDEYARAQARQRAAREQQEQEQAQRLRHEDDRRAAAAKAAEADTLDSITVTGARVQTRRSPRYVQEAAAPAPAPAAPPPPPAASAGSVQPSAARNALRRTDLQVPVDEDGRLPPDEWLDRIRLRRDLGDSANALRSLQLFVQEHPFQRVPDDLRPLLGTP